MKLAVLFWVAALFIIPAVGAVLMAGEEIRYVMRG